jgi:hypothetical protein
MIHAGLQDLAEANQAIGEATAAIKIAERGAAEADTAMQKSAMAAVATAATAEDLRGQLPSLKQGAKVRHAHTATGNEMGCGPSQERTSQIWPFHYIQMFVDWIGPRITSWSR